MIGLAISSKQEPPKELYQQSLITLWKCKLLDET